MTDQLAIQQVRIQFVGPPPARLLERATGVSQVAIEGSILRCLVHGSFQPLLEAIRGYEVIALESIASNGDAY